LASSFAAKGNDAHGVNRPDEAQHDNIGGVEVSLKLVETPSQFEHEIQASSATLGGASADRQCSVRRPGTVGTKKLFRRLRKLPERVRPMGARPLPLDDDGAVTNTASPDKVSTHSPVNGFCNGITFKREDCFFYGQ
jgi:hypothetical protein